MKKISVFLALLLLLGCSTESAPPQVTIKAPEENPMKQAAQKLDQSVQASGQTESYDANKVFASSCSACHDNISTLAKALPSNITEEQVISIISNGYKDMPSLSSILKEGEIQSIAKEIVSIQSK